MLLYTKDKEVCFSWLRGYYIVGDDLRSNSIFGKLLRKAQNGEKTFPLNSGKNMYDFINIEDFCCQIMLATFSEQINGIINVCSGTPMTLGERVEQFVRENNLNITLQYGAFPDRPYDSPIVYGDNSKMICILDNSKIKK